MLLAGSASWRSRFSWELQNWRIMTGFFSTKFWSIDKRKQETPLSEAEAFGYFACEQVLKRYDLAGDEVDAGIVDGSGDGGIDAVFTFLDEHLVVEDSEILSDDAAAATIRRGVGLELHVLQVKRESGFGETAIQKASSSLELLLDLSLDEEDLGELYSSLVIDRFSIFRRALAMLATKHPAISIDFWYVTRGKVETLSNTVKLQSGTAGPTATQCCHRCRSKSSLHWGERTSGDGTR